MGNTRGDLCARCNELVYNTTNEFLAIVVERSKHIGVFKDRQNAGELLSRSLREYKNKKDTIVLGIPRGGVVVAKVVAGVLDLPLDIVVTKKIGAPRQEELAIGAVGPGGEVVWDMDLIQDLDIDEDYLRKGLEEKYKEVKRREREFRKGKKPLRLENKSVILVDDGIATGATVKAAIKYLRNKKVKRIILAAPVASEQTVNEVKGVVDKSIIPETPKGFRAVGQFYEYFPQVEDQEVIQLLQ